MHTYIHMYVHVYVCIYIYVYTDVYTLSLQRRGFGHLQVHIQPVADPPERAARVEDQAATAAPRTRFTERKWIYKDPQKHGVDVE